MIDYGKTLLYQLQYIVRGIWYMCRVMPGEEQRIIEISTFLKQSSNIGRPREQVKNHGRAYTRPLFISFIKIHLSVCDGGPAWAGWARGRFRFILNKFRHPVDGWCAGGC
jgi:hypothetical protein